jgi:hypothetical protein
LINAVGTTIIKSEEEQEGGGDKKSYIQILQDWGKGTISCLFSLM